VPVSYPPPDAALAGLRAAYARDLAAETGTADPRLVASFASVPREDFLGPGPWWIGTRSGFVLTPDDNPAHLYANCLVAIDRARGINNGEPALHMRAIAELQLLPDQRVAHIGCGTGYYSAILAECVGAGGVVAAFEAEPDLEAEARRNLAAWPQVAVRGLASAVNFGGPHDAVYASAAATAPRPEWLEAVAPGGRIVFPLTDRQGRGVMLCLTRSGAQFDVTLLGRVSFIPMKGAIDDADSLAVAQALRNQTFQMARIFRVGASLPAESPVLVVSTGRFLAS
jgi:protein-L-isoaspartate(D-aspartate) O-methyltransferase